MLGYLTNIQERVWMPYQVGLEYHRQRVEVINRHSKKYTDIEHRLEILLAELEHKKQHPFVSEDVVDEFKIASQNLNEELTAGKAATISLIRDDRICTKLTDVFDGRVGVRHSDEWLDKIYAEGKERFSKKIPPGFKDDGKEAPLCYGDLVIWKEILSKAEEDSVSVIFVTDDVKEDWWRIANGDKLGPHVDLLDEFRLNTGQDIHFYTTDTFLKQAKASGYSIASGTLDEVKSANQNRVSFQSEYDYLKSKNSIRYLDENEERIGWPSTTEEVRRHLEEHKERMRWPSATEEARRHFEELEGRVVWPSATEDARRHFEELEGRMRRPSAKEEARRHFEELEGRVGWPPATEDARRHFEELEGRILLRNRGFDDDIDENT